MRQLKHLSPTSISLFIENQQEFYLAYLADRRPPKVAQTQPMSCGSAFDAYAKSFLHERLFGKGYDPKFDLDAIFEAQVEPQNRDFAREAGAYLFDQYRKLGSLADLMIELQGAIGAPRFELDMKGVINGSREGATSEIDGVIFNGKPDVFYINKHGAHVILDWKVNGYCSNYAMSPMQGYIKLREHGKVAKSHKDAQVMAYNGTMINVAGFLDQYDPSWARQLSIYAWLCGEEIGHQFVAAIDQLVCKKVPVGKPEIRVAEHRTRIQADFQWQTFEKAQQIWDICKSDHFFRDLSLEDSQAKCRLLDGVADALTGEGTPEDRWFTQATRS